MAIYHFSVKIISRSKGSSSVASAAYRSGEKLEDERTGLVHDYTRKTGVEYNEIIAPENASAWTANREELWNTAEASEKRKDAQLAREINAALPIELNCDQQIELVKGFVKENFADKGMIADISIHDNSKGNPHIHIMLTTRELTEDGFGKKNREWNRKENIDEWREQWAVHTNRTLEKYGFQERIDHRSLKEQGIDRIPQIHVGVHANAMEKKGMETERGAINKEIKELNNQRVIAIAEYKKLKDEQKRYSNLTDEEKKDVLRAESIIGKVQNYNNSNKVLTKFNDVKMEKFKDIKYFEDKIRSTEYKIKDIEKNLKGIDDAENRIKNMPKIFGIYKDRKKVKELKNNIEVLNKNLLNLNYKDRNDFISMKNMIKNFKENIEELNKEIEKINGNSYAVRKGVKALENKEIREFCMEYKEKFINPKNISYKEMKSIKAVNELAGEKLSIKNLYYNADIIKSKLKKIDNILRDIENSREEISMANEAFNKIEELNPIAEKYDKKIIGRNKYRREHQHEKDEYDRTLRQLEKLNINTKDKLMRKEKRQENRERNIKPKLEAEVIKLQPVFKIIDAAASIFRVKEYEYKLQEKERERRRINHRKRTERCFEMEH